MTLPLGREVSVDQVVQTGREPGRERGVLISSSVCSLVSEGLPPPSTDHLPHLPTSVPWTFFTLFHGRLAFHEMKASFICSSNIDHFSYVWYLAVTNNGLISMICSDFPLKVFLALKTLQ